MQLVWIFGILVAGLVSTSNSASVSYDDEVNNDQHEFLNFKIKYNKAYKNEEEERFRMMILIENKFISDNVDHYHADKLSHELDSDFVVDEEAEEFEEFMETYNKAYESDEEQIFRQKVFIQRKKEIDAHNERYFQDLESYQMGVNEFTDMLYHELEATKLGVMDPIESEYNSGFEYIPPTNADPPVTVDWRAKGAVTPVKNQGPCGSCWAFAAAGALESRTFLKTKTLVNVSEQNLVDCAREKYWSHGCRGGHSHGALKYIMENKGIDSETSYPYKAVQDSCHFDSKNVVATVRGFAVMRSGSETTLKSAVSVGPVAVYMRVCNSLYTYHKGVYNDQNCAKNRNNHAVLAVGYGTDPKEGDYWLIKNSWGTKWGEKGYFKLARNRGNTCGIGTFGTFPLV